MAQQLFFEKELEKLLNTFSQENRSNTPDFILANYIQQCLTAFNSSINQRDRWYNFEPFDNLPDSAKNINL